MLRLYYSEISGLDAQVSDATLSEYRREKLRKQVNQNAFRMSIGAELLLNQATARKGFAAPLDIVTGEKGKPMLRDSALQFSLSHSGNFVFCGLSYAPLGVDVQQIKKCSMAVVRRCFTAAERNLLDSSSNVDFDYTLLWSLKESYVKQGGDGIFGCPLDSFEICPDNCGGAVVSGENSLKLWYRRLGNYVFTACFDARDRPESFEYVQLS